MNRERKRVIDTVSRTTSSSSSSEQMGVAYILF